MFSLLFDGNATDRNSDNESEYAEGDSDDEAFVSFKDNCDGGNDRQHRQRAQSTSRNEFGPEQATSLTRYLVQTQLPRLSGLEQMHLMALADTIANGGSWGMEVAAKKPQKQGLIVANFKAGKYNHIIVKRKQNLC